MVIACMQLPKDQLSAALNENKIFSIKLQAAPRNKVKAFQWFSHSAAAVSRQQSVNTSLHLKKLKIDTNFTQFY